MPLKLEKKDTGREIMKIYRARFFAVIALEWTEVCSTHVKNILENKNKTENLSIHTDSGDVLCQGTLQVDKYAGSHGYREYQIV